MAKSLESRRAKLRRAAIMLMGLLLFTQCSQREPGAAERAKTSEKGAALAVNQWPLETLTATNSIALEDRATLVGDAVVTKQATGAVLSSNAELALGFDAVLTGSVKADTLVLRDRAVITGTARYNGITNTGTIQGGGSSPLSLPLFSIPTLPNATPGSQDITLTSSQQQTRQAGAYRDVLLNSGNSGTPTRLTLSGGLYHFKSLTVQNDAGVQCSTPCEVRIQGRAAFGDRSFLKPQSGVAGLGVGNVELLIGGANGAAGPAGWPAALEVNNDGQLRAYTLTPNGTVRLGHRTVLQGKVVARDVLVGFDSDAEGLQLPLISTQPVDVTVREDQPASFSVTVSNAAGVTYRWQHNGVDIAGPAGAGATYTLAHAAVSADGAQFRVKVTNAAGTVTSNAATLHVIPCEDTDTTCNAFDDDCNGVNDDGFGPKCNLEGGTAVLHCAGGTVIAAPCTNGNACDGMEVCQNASCQGGPDPIIDDGNPCTADGCIHPGGVQHEPLPAGTDCGDSNDCNGIDECSSTGECTHSDPIFSSDPCLIDVCESATGWTQVPAPAGTACDDLDASNGTEACDGAGVCAPARPLNHFNTPAPAFRARWLYPSGESILSFSARPPPTAGALSVLESRIIPARQMRRIEPSVAETEDDRRRPSFLGFESSVDSTATESEFASLSLQDEAPFPILQAQTPGDEPLSDPFLPLEIQNLTQGSLGIPVAYTVTMRTWYGSIWIDSVVQPLDAEVTLAPGGSTTLQIDLMTHLQVRMPSVAAKAEVIVGLHRLGTDGTPEPDPFAFTAGDSFFYNYNGDLTGIYTYGLEAEAGSDVMNPRPGLVERYTAVTGGTPWLGDDMFAPQGSLGALTALEARALFKEHALAHGFRGAVYSSRVALHDVDDYGVLPGVLESPIPPGGVVRPDGPEGTQPWDGVSQPTILCALWPTSFVDNGSEHLPDYPTPDVWQDTVDFVPASFAYADLHEADGSVVASAGILNADGCFQPQNLGPGFYYVRVFSTMFSGASRASVERVEPGTQTFEQPRGKVISLTMALELFETGVGSRHDVGTGIWLNETNVAAVASHALKRHGEVDMGIRSTPSAPDAPKPYRMLVNMIYGSTNDELALTSNFVGQVSTLLVMPSRDGWAHDARWKFVVGHELGHMVENFAGAAHRPAEYYYEPGTNILQPGELPVDDSVGNPDPVSAMGTPELIDSCTCATSIGGAAAHCLQSIENAESAASEGFAHFYASRLWNRLPSEGGTSCNFQYYKPIAGTGLFGAPQFPPFGVDCGVVYAHRDVDCGEVFITDVNGALVTHGSELDWLTLYWDLTTDTGSPTSITMSGLMEWLEETSFTASHCINARTGESCDCDDCSILLPDPPQPSAARRRFTFELLGLSALRTTMPPDEAWLLQKGQLHSVTRRAP